MISDNNPARDPPCDGKRFDLPTDSSHDSARDSAIVQFHWFGWTRRDQAVIAGLVVLVLALMGIQWLRHSRWSDAGKPIEVVHLDPVRLNYRLDINRASWIEFVQLEAVGEVLARRIVADREENGPFESVDDLRRVRGIGAKTLEKLRPYLTVKVTNDEEQPDKETLNPPSAQ